MDEAAGGRLITAKSDFFDIGGDSLLALQVVLEMEAHLGIPIPLRLLYQARTPRGLAACLTRHETVSGFGHLVPLRAANGCEGIPLFLMHDLRGGLFHWLPLVRQLPAHIPVYGLQGDEESTRGRTFNQTVADYVTEIRKFRPHGPYFVAGYSLGGVVAHEMACQLNEHGGEPVRLFLIDTYPQNLPRPQRWVMDVCSGIARNKQRLGLIAKGALAGRRHPEARAELAKALPRWRRRLTGPKVSSLDSFGAIHGTPCATTLLRRRHPLHGHCSRAAPEIWLEISTAQPD